MEKATLIKLPEGWRFVDTPSHGYLYPSERHNQNVPSSLRKSNYEEDCEWAIPVFFNSELFENAVVENATKSFKDWNPQQYEKKTGQVLQPGESYMKDEFYYKRKNAVGKIEACAAFGDWCFGVPKGYVYFFGIELKPEDVKMKISKPSGIKESFLIPQEKYRNARIFNREELIPFTRDESFYTWDDYTHKTGKARFDVPIPYLAIY